MNREHDRLLKSVSRSFYLSLCFLPESMREPVSLGYLLARLTDTVADAEGIDDSRRLKLLNEIRLLIQGQADSVAGLEEVADSLTHPGETELLSRQAELFAWYSSIDPANRDHLMEVILTIIHGQRWDVSYFRSSGVTACASAEDLLRYTYWVAGCVGEFWTKVGFTNLGEKFARPDEAGRMLISGRKLGQALQLINILRDLHEDLPVGRCYLPGDELKAQGWDGDEMPAYGQIEPVFFHWLNTSREFLDESGSYVRNLRNARVRGCTNLPRLMASKTADRLDRAGIRRVLNERIKVDRFEVWQAMLQAIFC